MLCLEVCEIGASALFSAKKLMACARATAKWSPPSLERAQRVGMFETTRTDGLAETFVELQLRHSRRQRRQGIRRPGGCGREMGGRCGRGIRCGCVRFCGGDAPGFIERLITSCEVTNIIRNDRAAGQEGTEQQIQPEHRLHRSLRFIRRERFSPDALRKKSDAATSSQRSRFSSWTDLFQFGKACGK